MTFLVAGFLFQVAKSAYSATGLPDFYKSLENGLKGRFKKSFGYAVQGGLQLGVSVALYYYLFHSNEPLARNVLHKSNRDFDSSVSTQEIAFAFQNKLYEPGSKAEAVSIFCQFFFRYSQVNNFEVAKYCLEPLSTYTNGNSDVNWLKDPINSAYRASKTLNEIGFEVGEVKYSPQKICAEVNRAKNVRFDLKSSCYHPSREKHTCENVQALYLKYLFELSTDEAEKVIQKACQPAFGLLDPCLEEVNQIKMIYQQTF